MEVVECSVWPLFWQIHRPSYDVHYMEEITEDIDLREKKALLLLSNDPGLFLTALTISIKQSWSLGWAPRLNNTVKECCILHSLSLYCGTVQMIRLGNDD